MISWLRNILLDFRRVGDQLDYIVANCKKWDVLKSAMSDQAADRFYVTGDTIVCCMTRHGEMPARMFLACATHVSARRPPTIALRTIV